MTMILAVAVDTAATPDLSHPWGLEECISWALEHNLNVVQQEMSRQNSEIELNTAQWSLAPSVQASASENWNFGRGLGGDNTYASGNSSTMVSRTCGNVLSIRLPFFQTYLPV